MNRNILLLVAAMILFVIAALLDFGTITADNPHTIGLVALGLTAFAGAHIP